MIDISRDKPAYIILTSSTSSVVLVQHASFSSGAWGEHLHLSSMRPYTFLIILHHQAFCLHLTTHLGHEFHQVLLRMAVLRIHWRGREELSDNILGLLIVLGARNIEPRASAARDHGSQGFTHRPVSVQFWSNISGGQDKTFISNLIL